MPEPGLDAVEDHSNDLEDQHSKSAAKEERIFHQHHPVQATGQSERTVIDFQISESETLNLLLENRAI